MWKSKRSTIHSQKSFDSTIIQTLSLKILKHKQNTHSVINMVRLNFVVNIQLVIKGQPVSTLKILEKNRSAPSGYYYAKYPKSMDLIAWLGGENRQTSIYPIDPKTSNAIVQLDLQDDDLDTIKFLVSINVVTGTCKFSLPLCGLFIKPQKHMLYIFLFSFVCDML